MPYKLDLRDHSFITLVDSSGIYLFSVSGRKASFVVMFSHKGFKGIMDTAVDYWLRTENEQFLVDKKYANG